MTKSCVSVQASKSNRLAKPPTFVASRCGLPRPYGSFKTPIRRFFKFDALKPNANGMENKRAGADDYDIKSRSFSDPPVTTPSLSSDLATSPTAQLDTPDVRGPSVDPAHSVLSQHNIPPIPPCMALQNSDHSIDAIVISTLLELPFCCHEDLLTMSPDRIVKVAQEINERLPGALKIDLGDSKDIRRKVEKLVGIVKSVNKVSVPGAPLKKIKSRGGRRAPGKVSDVAFLDQLDLAAISPPVSPLAAISAAKRDRRRVGQRPNFGATASPTKLAILREEDEDEDGGVDKTRPCDIGTDTDEDVFRAAKKRKTSASSAEVEMITPTMHHIKVPALLKKLYDDINDTSPTKHQIVRGRSEGRVVFDENSVGSARNASSKVIVKTTVIDRSLVHTRARYRSSSSKFAQIQNAPAIGQTQIHGPLQTSTPKLDQIGIENRSLVTKDRISPSRASHKSKRSVRPKSKKLTSSDWNVGISKMPGYRRMKRESLPRMDGMMGVEVDRPKGAETHKTF